MVANIYVQDCVYHKTRLSSFFYQLIKPKILHLSDSLEDMAAIVAGRAVLTFTFMHLADALIQSDFQERALPKSIGH